MLCVCIEKQRHLLDRRGLYVIFLIFSVHLLLPGGRTRIPLLPHIASVLALRSTSLSFPFSAPYLINFPGISSSLLLLVLSSSLELGRVNRQIGGV